MIDQETLNTFDELYFDTYQDVLKYIVINCSNIEDVKDIIQNVYLEVIKKMNNKNIQMNKSYIIGIAKNKIVLAISLASAILPIGCLLITSSFISSVYSSSSGVSTYPGATTLTLILSLM